MHVTTEAPTADGTPTRTSTILSNHYFLDRLLVPLATLPIVHVVFLRLHMIDRAMERYTNMGICNVDGCQGREVDYLPFEEGASLPEMYVQIFWSNLTWEPIAIALAACAVVAVALEVRSR